MAEAEIDGALRRKPRKCAALDLSKKEPVDLTSPLSPKSPCSVFSKTVLEGSKGCMLHAVLLSQWDNILGPKIRHLWTCDKPNNVTLPVLSHIASHTLSGEICRDPTAGDIDTKFYVMKDKGLAVTAFVFGAMGVNDMAVHSLSVVIPQTQLSAYLHLYELCLSWIRRFLAKLRILLDRGPTSLAMSNFTRYLNSFVLMLRSLSDAGLNQHIPLSDTAFHPDQKLDVYFLRKAITSHLMTCGRSVILGKSAAKVNLMIATLALFLTPTERLCSRFVVEGEAYPYHPDVVLQGMLRDADGQLTPPLREVLLSRYPTTLIDMSTEEVRQSSTCGDHASRQHELIKDELRCVWTGLHELTVYPHRILFEPFPDEPETFVKNFMEEMALLPAVGGVREAFIQHFLRIIERRAMSLIKYLEAETNHGKNQLRQSQKKIRQDLSLSLPGDFLLVLCVSDKLRPGVYNLVNRDPKVEAEQRHHINNNNI